MTRDSGTRAGRSTRIYQTTDLTTSKRREFVDDARSGCARLRIADGETLVALPEGDLSVLEALRGHALAMLSLENAVSRSRHERRAIDFGELAWAAILDDDDLAAFRRDFADALATALADRSVAALEELIRAWRLTCDLLRDPEAMARVDNPDPSDVEVLSPKGLDGAAAAG